MDRSSLNIPIKEVRGVGEARAKLFAKLGIHTALDLLRHFPRSYTDLNETRFISELSLGDEAVIRARVTLPVTERFIRKGMTVYSTVIADDSGAIRLTIFNRKYAAASLKVGSEFLFKGRIDHKNGYVCMVSPEIIPVSKAGGMKAGYPLTAGLTSNIISNCVKNVLDSISSPLTDILPKSVRTENALASPEFCYHAIHFPKNYEEVNIARRRFIFEELFLFQLGLQMIKGSNRGLTGTPMKQADISDFYASLPFTLTEGQLDAVSEITEDMQGARPMQRMLQGDVGSGKTAVAAAAMYFAHKNGYQSVLMAPTEILAAQHKRTLSEFLAPLGVSVGLLTGSTPAARKRELKAQLANGEISMLVSTHAALTDDTVFASLGLAITDEQHRFGVRQRGILASKSKSPHVLIMSATPIPRTLALIMYGDLDISILKQLPKGRGKISTYSVNGGYRRRVFNFIRNNVDEGRQAYLVCPLVEENEELSAASAKQYYTELSAGEFRGYSVGLVYGKMPPKEKDSVMKRFADGEISILISTTVIEVGVDVPNASVMVIENAERYGLSQLHQLRGRIGRGQWDSHCILISDSESAAERLKFMSKTSDGFKIAEKDLELRGPGDLIGNRQHGLPEFEIADLERDMNVFYDALAAAKHVFSTDPNLTLDEHAPLRKWIDRMFSRTP